MTLPGWMDNITNTFEAKSPMYNISRDANRACVVVYSEVTIFFHNLFRRQHHSSGLFNIMIYHLNLQKV